jgi:MscS family membrane protein
VPTQLPAVPATFAVALATTLLLLFHSDARAQAPGPLRPTVEATPAPTPAAPGEASAPEHVLEAPDSPRASVRAFIELTTRKGDYPGAARYLLLPAGEEARGPEVVRRLRAVLERSIEVDLDALSPLAEGATDDGLPPGVDLVGKVPNGRGGEDPVYVVRSRDAEGHYWAFSRHTVSRIDGWYDALPDRWVRAWMPAKLQLYGPQDLMWWQWLALPVLGLLALVLGRVLGSLTTSLLRRIFKRTTNRWDERLLERTSPALTLLAAVVVASILLGWLALLPTAEAFVRSCLGGIATVAVFWALWRSVDVWSELLLGRAWAVGNPSARSLISVGRNLGKAFVVVAGVVATLAALGYPVATVVAGLGIGGVALAFGAQKTIENLFGSVSLAADQPFRVGDFVRIEDFVGNVEHIGMRSTQIRTLDRTLITIPNGKLAEMRIEEFASRDRIRLALTLGLSYGTSEEQIRRILAGLEGVLRRHPHTWPDTVVVNFLGLGASSLDVEVMAWCDSGDFDLFRDYRQEVLLGFMKVVEEAGSSFAFPTRTVHLVGSPSISP